MLELNNDLLKGVTFIDLFAGLGGFRIALESLGAICVYSNECDKFAKDVYNKNFNIIPDDDITLVDEKEIPTHDILCAGFPCQAFSISGKQQGFEDARGTLFFDIARIVEYKKPKIVFMENVKNFIKHDNGNTIMVVKNTMENLGYKFFYSVLNASDYGIPQNRERVYMVCFRDDLNINNFIFPNSFKLRKSLKDFLEPAEVIPHHLYVHRDDISINLENNNKLSNKPIRLGFINQGRQGERIYSIHGSAITLSANGGGIFARTGGYYINGKYRRLTTRECARIMGYPDSYKICENKNQAYKQFGNSVVIDVLQYIALEIVKSLELSDENINNKIMTI